MNSRRNSEIEEVLQELHRAFFLLHKMSDRCLSDNSDITLSQFMILRTIDANSPLSASDVAERLNITKAAVSRHLDNLIEASFIERLFNDNNHREYILTISDIGKRELQKSREILEINFSPKISKNATSTSELIRLLRSIMNDF